MNLNIAICDDSARDRAGIRQLLMSYSFNHDQDFHVEEFESGGSLIKGCQKDKPFQVLFLDIEMPDEDGITVAERIRRLIDRQSILVFFSSYPRYMQDSFRAHPYYFLQKPVKQAEIDALMSDILYDIGSSKSLLSIVDGYDNEYAIRLDELYYIETADAKNKELRFHLRDKNIPAKGTLAAWRDLLKDHAFHAASRTVLVNLEHIYYISDQAIALDNDEVIAVTRRNRKELLAKYLNQVVTLKRGRRMP